MSFFAKGISAVLGRPEREPSVSESVERLRDRVQSSTLIDDRRDALETLKNMAKENRLEVGTHCLTMLVTVLKQERNDTEMINDCLETLLNLVTLSDSGDTSKEDNGLAVQFTDNLTKRQDNAQLLLDLLDEYDFQVRWPAVRLLTALLQNKPTRLQECILASPVGISRVMDLLSDSREVVRNDALLLMVQLTKNNAQIQKLVAFESGFDRLLDIIAEEGHSDGGIVAEDCLRILHGLLHANSSNQTYFREANLISRLTLFFELEQPASGSWLPQKVSNLMHMLQLVCALVPHGTGKVAVTTAASQRAMQLCGLLSALCHVMFAPGLPTSLLTQAIVAVAAVIRGHTANQSEFAQVQVGADPPRSAVLAVMMTLVTENQDVELRLASLYCLQSFLLGNEPSQAHMVATLLPSSSDQAPRVSAGQLLCAGLFSSDINSAWCSAAALSSVASLPAQKEQLLRVQLAVSAGAAPVSLLLQAAMMASRPDLNVAVRAGLLQFLSRWVHGCGAAVAALLRSSSAVQFLLGAVEEHPDADNQHVVRGLASVLLGVSLLLPNDEVPSEYTPSMLLELVRQRCTMDGFVGAFVSVTQSEFFLRAGQQPKPRTNDGVPVMYTYDFVQLYRDVSDDVISKVRGEEVPSPVHKNGVEQTDASPDANQSTNAMQHAAALSSYKELIREQDMKLNNLRQEMDQLTIDRNQVAEERDRLRLALEEMRTDFMQRQQPIESSAGLLAGSAAMAAELQELRQMCATLSEVRSGHEKEMTLKDEEISNLRQQLENARTISSSFAPSFSQPDDGEQLRRALASAEATIATQRERLTSLEQKLEAWAQGRGAPHGGEESPSEELATLKTRVTELLQERDALLKTQEVTRRESDGLLSLVADQDKRLTALQARLSENSS